jgi:tRNA nucleotidyltransferase (CCA-adding enzyme)
MSIVDKLYSNGYEAYIVGGCVRDYVLGNKNPHDYDIVTNARPQETLELFSGKGFQVTTLGVIHGSIKVWIGNYDPIDVTTFGISPWLSRTDGEPNKYSDNIDDDLARRDFTMNALAYDPSNGNIIDIFDGISDINRRLIKSVNDPNVSLIADPFQIIRAYRFAMTLGFDIDDYLYQAITVHMGCVSSVSEWRKGNELRKILSADFPLSRRCLIYQIVRMIRCMTGVNFTNTYDTITDKLLFNTGSNLFQSRFNIIMNNIPEYQYPKVLSSLGYDSNILDSVCKV